MRPPYTVTLCSVISDDRLKILPQKPVGVAQRRSKETLTHSPGKIVLECAANKS